MRVKVIRFEGKCKKMMVKGFGYEVAGGRL